MCCLKSPLLSFFQLSFSLTFLWTNQKLNLKSKAVYAQMREKVSDDLKFCRELRFRFKLARIRLLIFFTNLVAKW